MKLSENRRLAVIVLIFVIVSVTIVSGGLSMLNRKGDLEESFMTGDLYDVVARCEKSARLLSQTAGLYLSADLLSQYCSESTASALTTGGYTAAAASLAGLCDSLSGAKNPSECLAALSALDDAVELTYTGVGMLTLENNLQRDVKLAYNDYKGARDILSRDGEEPDSYTALAKEFNRDITGFPAAQLAMLFGATSLPLLDS